jgi:hypothetical protein
MTSAAPALSRHPGFLELWAARTVSGFGARIAREDLQMAAVLLLQAPPTATEHWLPSAWAPTPRDKGSWASRAP